MATENFIRLALAGLLAVIPALFWGYIFYKKQPENKRLIFNLFLSGMLAVAPLLLYKYLWQFFPWINAFVYTNSFADDFVGFSNLATIPVNVLLTFMVVGLIEETAKFLAVKTVPNKKICSVTDSIEFFIIVALGFAFAENIIYFYNIMNIHGTGEILMPFVFRSLFSTFAHVLFSGVLGYFYGEAVLAKPILNETYNRRRWTVLRVFSKLIGYKKEILFHHEMLVEGFFWAIVLHSSFNIFLEMNWTFMIVPILAIGFMGLSYSFENKRIDKSYCMVES